MQGLEIVALGVVYSAWVGLLLWLISGGPEKRQR